MVFSKTALGVIRYSPLMTAGVSFSLFLLAATYGWLGIADGVGSNFCEAAREGIIKQPANTFSNFGFMIAGIMMGFQLASGRFSSNENPLTRDIFYAVFFPCIAVLLGPGSMAMHGTETHLGGFLDVMSMFLVSSFLAAYAIRRFFNLGHIAFLLLYGVFLYIGYWAIGKPYSVILGHFGSEMFGVFILLGVTFELLNTYIRKMSHSILMGYIALGCLITAFIIWNFWQTGRVMCDPHSLWQGHAAWHLLCAAAVYFLFRYYVSERREGT